MIAQTIDDGLCSFYRNLGGTVSINRIDQEVDPTVPIQIKHGMTGNVGNAGDDLGTGIVASSNERIESSLADGDRQIGDDGGIAGEACDLLGNPLDGIKRYEAH